MIALDDCGFECWEESQLLMYLKRTGMVWDQELPTRSMGNASRWIARARQLVDLLGDQPRFHSLVLDLTEKTDIYWAYFPEDRRPLPEDVRSQQKEVATEFHKVFKMAEQIYGQQAAQKARVARQGPGL